MERFVSHLYHVLGLSPQVGQVVVAFIALLIYFFGLWGFVWAITPPEYSHESRKAVAVPVGIVSALFGVAAALLMVLLWTMAFSPFFNGVPGATLSSSDNQLLGYFVIFVPLFVVFAVSCGSISLGRTMRGRRD